MVFSSSPPLYLDPPNWHHQLQLQSNHQHESRGENPQLPPPPPPPLEVVGGVGSIRSSGSMVDRARVAKIPQPEAGLNCPRCDSTNTKFCYFNNYSLSQPRHFCKTCRRYWTRGGALRSVPVGGGCRRNKRTKTSTSSSSKSQPSSSKSEQLQLGTKCTNSATPSSTTTTTHHHLPQFSPQFPFMPYLQNHMSQYNNGGNLGVLQPHMVAIGGGRNTDLGFQLGGGNTGGEGDQWRMHFMGGGGNIDPNSNLYQFQSEGFEPPSNSLVGDHHRQLLESMAAAASSSVTANQVAPVKMEDTQRLNLPRGLLGISENNQFWGTGNPWTDLSGLNSS